jgi:hypothetical protein
LRHGLSSEDFLPVAESPTLVITVSEDPLVEMRLGFDRNARALEIGCELRATGWVIFHADKITKTYLVLLKEAQ